MHKGSASTASDHGTVGGLTWVGLSISRVTWKASNLKSVGEVLALITGKSEAFRVELKGGVVVPLVGGGSVQGVYSRELQGAVRARELVVLCSRGVGGTRFALVL